MALIAAAKRSPAYRAIRPRVADPCPSDGWYEGGCAFVVFDLTSLGEGAHGERWWSPQAVFALARDTGDVLAARVVEGQVNAIDTDPVVHNLLRETGAGVGAH